MEVRLYSGSRQVRSRPLSDPRRNREYDRGMSSKGTEPPDAGGGLVTVKLDYEWRLRVLLADRGIYTAAQLGPHLESYGCTR